MIEVKFVERIAQEVSAKPEQVAKAIELFDSGATIPFVARYRKDVTGNLNEVQLESIADGNTYFAGLIARRNAVLKNIEKQGKLSDDLRARIEACENKVSIEDLYLPFKKSRPTKATVAKQKGLEPLAVFLCQQDPAKQDIDGFAQTFVRAEKAVSSVEEALDGARYIVSEWFTVDAQTRALIRERMLAEGQVTARSTKNADGKKTKFESYYDFSEPVAKIPSHRALAVLRGVKNGVLRVELTIDDERMFNDLMARHIKSPGSPYEEHLRMALKDAYDRHLRPAIEHEVMGIVRKQADDEAIRVFRENTGNLLLAPPAGSLTVIGVDPGVRTGCKLAVVDKTGAFLEHQTVHPHEPEKDVEGTEKTLLELIEKYRPDAIAIGNGTGGRETGHIFKEILAKHELRKPFCVFVNEAGASTYSASKIARDEFPDLDVTIRGAVSIARRLQDPLAELVKIEPRHIGVGQYQHDVNQRQLRDGLHRTVVSCVNKVGVSLNTASVELLRYIAGIHMGTAQNIVARRTELSGFASRQQLMEVDGVGPKVFEQCAGFMRIEGAANPLDATSIHPEAYPVVEKIAASLEVPVTDLVRNHELIKKIDFAPFETETVGQLELRDIRSELLKPGRDPRADFRIPKFIDGVTSVADLEENMEMEGVVTNVTDFGAFVDVGVHQDGLVHLSEMANRFVQDPRQLVKVGQIVKVKVLKVDKDVPRISLSMKACAPPPKKRPARPQRPPEGERPSAPPAEGQAPAARSDDRPRRPQEQRPDRPERPRSDDRAPRDDRPRGPRPDRGPDRGPRPDSRQGDRDRGPRRGDDRGPRRPDRRPGSDRPPMRSDRDDDSNKPLGNTQLADQLAALRDKFK